MRLANAAQAIVPEAKLADYLLAPSHKDGGPKAEFLRRFGFDLSNRQALREALLDHARAHDVVRTRVTPFGRNFEVLGPLSTPDGRNPTIRSVWAIDDGETSPRLITIVPA